MSDAGWFHGVLHVTIHEAADLPGDPTMISVCHPAALRLLIRKRHLPRCIDSHTSPRLTHVNVTPQLCPSIVNGCLIGTSTMMRGTKPPPHPYVVVSIGNLKQAYTSVPPAT